MPLQRLFQYSTSNQERAVASQGVDAMFAVRAADASDEDFALECEIAYFDQPGSGKDPAEFVKLWSRPDSWPRREFRKALAQDRALIVVDTASNERVGYLRYEFKFETSRSTAYMSCLFVSPSARRKGLANGMVRVFSERAIAADIAQASLHVETWNHGAIAFYEKSGFTREGEEEPGLAMFKELKA